MAATIPSHFRFSRPSGQTDGGTDPFRFTLRYSRRVAWKQVHHGGPFRQAVEAGALDPHRTVQIGIRGKGELVWSFSYESGMRVIHVEEFYEMGWKNVVDETRRSSARTGLPKLRHRLPGPGLRAGTGTPEVGGITSFEAQQVIRGLRGLNFVGGDIVEVSPPFDSTGITALAGADLLFQIFCVVADTVAKRNADSGKA